VRVDRRGKRGREKRQIVQIEETDSARGNRRYGVETDSAQRGDRQYREGRQELQREETGDAERGERRCR
jgi:hypothetical protein